MPLSIDTIEDLAAFVERKLGVSDWVTISQDKINAFARLTQDSQWIHTDVERAARESPYGGPIVHGYFILSLAPYFIRQVVAFPCARLVVNYGLNRVRFTAPVPAGGRLRVHVVLVAYNSTEQGARLTLSLRYECEESSKPVCFAEIVTLLFT